MLIIMIYAKIQRISFIDSIVIGPKEIMTEPKPYFLSWF